MRIQKLLIISTLFLLLSPSHAATTTLNYFPGNNQSAAFLDGNIVTMIYTRNYTCTPALSSFYSNISTIGNITNCGIVVPTSLLGTLPIWVITPNFAGMSIFGYARFNSTQGGFPTYKGNTIVTDCGAGMTPNACPSSPSLRYNPANLKYEYHYRIYNGIAGLPEGLLPMPAHSYVLFNDYGGYPTPWYLVFVRVYDPNIFPNATTGKCTQVALSNLSDPTGNCLTSFDAIHKASLTRNSYIPKINANNPLWNVESDSNKQIIIVLEPNITGISGLLYPNSNIYLYMQVNRTNYYQGQAVREHTQQNAAQSGFWALATGVVILFYLVVNFLWFKFKKKRHW